MRTSVLTTNLRKIGIDIAKDFFDVALLLEGKSKHKIFSNTSEGMEQLGEWLAKQGMDKVHGCLEATGRYGEAVAEWLYEQGHTVSIVNPACIKAFGQSKLSRNKTDKGDCQLIAQYCQQNQPPAWSPSPPEVRQLQALIRQLESVQNLRQTEVNRLNSLIKQDCVVQLLEQHIAFLDGQIEQIKQLLTELIDTHQNLKEQQELLLSIPSVGELTAAKLLAEEIGTYESVRQVSAHAGVTPRQQISGSSVRGKTRLCKTGNAQLRKALYMPAMSARRFNPVIKAFCDRLLERGKAKRAIICAAMHKLLCLAYGVLRSGKPFDADYAKKILATP
ncbi:MAG: IS110 family transposase [Hormoscilla sp. SP5CHS1]|nr:IS110 family transposase [Hormoscilla sp. SP5CHS1]